MQAKDDNQHGISRISRFLKKLQDENEQLKQELHTMCKERSKSDKKSKAAVKQLSANSKKLHVLKTEVSAHRIRHPPTNSSKRPPAKHKPLQLTPTTLIFREKFSKLVGLVKTNKKHAKYFIRIFKHFDINSHQASPLDIHFTKFLLKILKTPFTPELLSTPVPSSYSTAREYSVPSLAAHEYRLGQLNQEISQTLSSTQKVLSESYAASPTTLKPGKAHHYKPLTSRRKH